MRVATTLALAASFGATLAQETYLGFNSGATFDDSKAKTQADFEKEFTTAKNLKGAVGQFTSARLYTNVQSGTEDTPIAAFPAAIKTKTKLLLGIWCSGTTSIDKELEVLTKAIDQYGKDFTDLVVGLSVGSEDMYRVSEPGIKNKAGVGQEATMIVKFVKAARSKLSGTALGSIPIGHVDTWTAWTNGSNKAVINEVDFIGTNLFPYYESDRGDNDISKAGELFDKAISATEGVAGKKPIWITETGWPTTGPTFGKATATMKNAESYWQDVGCKLFGKQNTWWYVLQDSNPDNEAKFGITKEFNTTPQYNLTCAAEVATPTSSGTPTSTPTSTAGAGQSQNGTTENNGNGNGGNGAPGAGSIASVSLFNAVSIGLSIAFAMAAWAA
ncbi:glycoside hydrolase family 17 protein [Aaosphaeria arxii CBS 175.79]|uniref:Glycoside hydrolase family 17 protein n=1 Tax=Aaosphaeria arxii CBS 175.79 TaxID=1450172 RepID=A0A6A5Y3Y9_9PLEO|nr:glycoside hydrolase family 17 protein [Aaosphaeria arxii CBS 175.79]KAF2020208.1 glycoside hydrolase family 17 protein [Aaosphaeria arxii CBS 175.79]